MLSIGILFAFAAMAFWGVGDFLIQKSTRRFGDWGTLLAIELFGVIILTPFVWNDLGMLFSFRDSSLVILSACSAVLLAAALLNFESLRQGKLAIVEPIHTLEIPIASILAFIVFGEGLALAQILLIVVLMAGLALVSMRDGSTGNRARLEKGAILAVLSAAFMGITTFMFGFSSRATNFILTNWFTALFLTMICLIYVVRTGGLSQLIAKARKRKGLVISTAAFDTFAWVAFALATTLSQIGIVVAISECYIIIASLLGIYVNKERMKRHQTIGLALSIVSAVLLAIIS
jgi:uncharacterized membrane protein